MGAGGRSDAGSSASAWLIVEKRSRTPGQFSEHVAVSAAGAAQRRMADGGASAGLGAEGSPVPGMSALRENIAKKGAWSRKGRTRGRAARCGGHGGRREGGFLEVDG